MSQKYPGGIISKTAPTPSGPYSNDTAPGVWTLEQQAYWQKLGQWPTAGNVNPSAFIENLFSTYLYTGTDTTSTGVLSINNGIDLAGKGGLVWIKARNTTTSQALFDTTRGTNKLLTSNTTAAQTDESPYTLGAFNSNGFSLGSATLGSYALVNGVGNTYASWTFREQAKFFDIVTYTGDGISGKTVAHNLGSVPGCIIVKRTNTSGTNWRVYHRELTALASLQLNVTNASAIGSTIWNDTEPTSTNFTVGDNGGVNSAGDTFVAYLFAHNAGGFGTSGSENVISCGSYTGNGSATGPVVTLGYEPQWLLVKNASFGSANWIVYDNMRGLPVGSNPSWLYPNTSGVEVTDSWGRISPTATGFQVATSDAWLNQSGDTIIYVAIRRGPMAVPTLGTSVFSPITYTGNDSTQTLTTNFSVDLMLSKQRGGSASTFIDRLRGFGTTADATKYLFGNSTDAEGTASDGVLGMTNTGINLGSWAQTNFGSIPYISWNMRRAPSFFDEVCYTGTEISGQTFNHNLGVVPEMMIVKARDGTTDWTVYHSALGASARIYLNATNAANTGTAAPWNSTTPTSTVFSLGNAGATNLSGTKFVNYLFATCAGVSKVGSYTGTGAAQTINCGFTAGSRFVMIKRTDSTGDWFVWDSARGIIPSNDPYLRLNSTAAEVTGTDYVDTTSVGFDITSTAPAAINANGGTFIFLAIA